MRVGLVMAVRKRRQCRKVREAERKDEGEDEPERRKMRVG